MKISIFTIALFFIASIALAAGIDGKWEGTYTGRMGGQPTKLSFDFKADNKAIIGTVASDQGPENLINNGKIDGNNISFDVKVDMKGGIILTIFYTGVLSGDELKLSFRTHAQAGGSDLRSGLSYRKDDNVKSDAPKSTFTFTTPKGGNEIDGQQDEQPPLREFILKRVK